MGWKLFRSRHLQLSYLCAKLGSHKDRSRTLGAANYKRTADPIISKRSINNH
jgi:hypothetical protein